MSEKQEKSLCQAIFFLHMYLIDAGVTHRHPIKKKKKDIGEKDLKFLQSPGGSWNNVWSFRQEPVPLFSVLPVVSHGHW